MPEDGRSPADAPSAEGLFEDGGRAGAIWKKAIQGIPLPPEDEARRALADIAGVALTTNPVAERLFARMEGRAPPAFDAGALVPRVAGWMLRVHPDADAVVLVAAGRTGAALAERKPATADGGESPSQTWKTVLWSMYLKLFNPESLEEARKHPLMASVLEGIGAAAATFGREDSDPPETPEQRLVQETRVILLKMLMTYHGIEMPAPPAPRRPWLH